MLIRYAVWLSSAVLFSGISCDTHEKFSGNPLEKQSIFLENDYAGSESQAFLQRVRRATSNGKLSISVTSLNIVEGRSDSVTCSGDDDLVWLDHKNKELKNSKGIKIQADKKKKQIKLTFSPAKTEHSGQYICKNKKRKITANFTLAVYQKPKAKIISTSKSYVAGDNFNLTCEGNSPNMSWVSSDGNPILLNSTGKNPIFTRNVTNGGKGKSTLVLSFRNVSMTQAGKYKCLVKVLTQEDSDSLSINVSPIKLNFSLEKDETSVVENNDFSVRCSGKVSQVWWTHNGKIVHLNHSANENVYVQTKKYDEQTLHFENVTKFDEGEYICHGNSTFNGQLLEKKFNLKVIDEKPKAEIIRSSKSYVAGDHFNLICEGNSPNMSWVASDGNPIPLLPKGQNPVFTGRVKNGPKGKPILVLSFRNVSTTQAGKYKCLVKLLNKEDSDSVSINISPIKLNFSPEKNETSLKEKDDFSVKCSGKVSQVWWTHNGKIVRLNHTANENVYVQSKKPDEQTLHFENVTKFNEGEYICHGNSTFNGDILQRKFKLNVKGISRDTHKKFLPGSPNKKKNISLKYGDIRPESQVSLQRIRRAISSPTGRVSIPITSLRIVEGKSDNVTCSGDSNDLFWLDKSNKALQQSKGIKMSANQSKKQIMLTFSPAKMEHSGRYVCKNKKSGITANFTLAVYQKPKAKIISTSKSYVAGDNFNLTCEGNSPNMSWVSSDGNPILLNSTGKNPIFTRNVTNGGKGKSTLVLSFRNASTTQAGKYKCLVKVLTQEDSDSLSIKVSHKKPKAKITYKSKSYVAGDNFDLVCEGNSPNISWVSQNGNPIPSNIMGQNPVFTGRVRSGSKGKSTLQLSFRNASITQTGKYKCYVQVLNEKDSDSVSINVFIPGKFINTSSNYTANENSDIKLECATTGNPKPIISWHRNGNPIIDEKRISYQGDSLLIKNVSHHDAGKYTCKAKQSSIQRSIIERTVTLNILHKPYFSVANVTIEKVKNQTSLLKCEADANPQARYTWYRNNSVVITASKSPATNLMNGTIELLLLNNTEYEVFICNATNSHGSNTQMVNVTVMQIPPTPTVKLLHSYQNYIKYQIIANRRESVTHFIIEYRENSSSQWNKKNETKADSDQHEYVLGRLRQNTTYLIRAKSVNPAGVSEFSKEEKITTSLANHLTGSLMVLFAVILMMNN